MNLSPSWVAHLTGHGFEAVNWSTIGAATAPDHEILAWAHEHNFVVITNDLDFSAILAASARATPSVVQIRTQDLLSDAVVSTVAHGARSAPGPHRAWCAAFNRRGSDAREDAASPPIEGSAFGLVNAHTQSPVSPFPGRLLWLRRGNRWGEPKLGSTVPPTVQPVALSSHVSACSNGGTYATAMFLTACKFGGHHAGGALCRRPTVGAAVAAEQSGHWGVSDPVSAAPDFARGPALIGSLTPRLRVSFVRTNVTAHSSSTRHSAWPRSWTPARRAQRRELGAHRRNFFPTGGGYAIDQAANARQATREAPHATRFRE
jgi:predicted nuclease of predicted toxin-antitoxin system